MAKNIRISAKVCVTTPSDMSVFFKKGKNFTESSLHELVDSQTMLWQVILLLKEGTKDPVKTIAKCCSKLGIPVPNGASAMPTENKLVKTKKEFKSKNVKNS